MSTAAVTIIAGWLGWRGWTALSRYGPGRAIRAGEVELVGPVVLGFVLAIVLLEQLWPAERRPILARGHRLDLVYLLAHGLFVVPAVVLIGTGFSTALGRAAPWLVLPHLSIAPRWCFIALALVAIDGVNWLVHLGNHRVNALWRLHAVHHSQEELSVLTTFRTHPLVHVSFVASAVPVLVLASNAATPTALLTTYACLGALPHANLRWTYGPVGKVLISPAYHRIHHRPAGRLDINLGVVVTTWDVLSRRAIFPTPGAAVPPTGLAGRPIPVEQGAPRLMRVLLAQWSEPFARSR